LKAATLKANKTAAKNKKGDGTKSPPKEHPPEEGQTCRPNSIAQKEVCEVQHTPSRRQQQRYCAQQQKEEAEAASHLI
jgi:hypothetical protein